MGLDRERIGEVALAFFRGFRARPRLLFLAACLAVTALAWWGMVRFADRLLAGLPANDAARTSVPVPLTGEELARRASETQRIDTALRAQRAAESLSAAGEATPGRAPVVIDTLAALTAGSPPASGSAGGFVATDQLAEPVYTVKPEWPDLAAQAGVHGTVTVQALVGPDGTVLEARVLNSIPLLNAAAESAVRKWRFRPASAGGVPVASWVNVPLTCR